MDLITLRAGSARLELAPSAGGSVARYGIERGGARVDLLRPWTAPDAGDPFEAAAFSLVPYSNRIREGRFAFRGRGVALPINRPPNRHSIHGHGWQSAWQPIEVRAAAAALEYRHEPDAWPWEYRATQRFALEPATLSIMLTLENTGGAPMPAGLGWHPYFPRTPLTAITADVRAVWLTDREVMPTALASPAPGSDPSRGVRVDAVDLDNCFVGWSRRAAIDWPEWSARVVMTAEPPLDVLVLYTPPGRDFFCAEPVSHVTDAFNLAAAGQADTGMRVLEPGETLAATVTVVVEA